MEDSQQQLLAKLRDSANVLVTVTANPSVDQLAGAIGLTLLLNKLSKHATAIFSGRVPEVMEFLQPQNVLEKNTDSLRDFIIALDKSKADKLRYKVEDTYVKIFITPYHTALTEKDLEFSQGDYNVDLIVAIGAHQQQDLDQAITSHGQILHDAVISSINNTDAGNLGTINWVDAGASSLCEMIFDLTQQLQPEGLDPQMATALLTGIVSETRRFGNDKTTAKSLETSSLLVAAGANQQLVAAKLEEHPAPIPEKKTAARPAATEAVPTYDTDTDTNKDPEAVPATEGTVTIQHEEKPADTEPSQIHIDDEGQLHSLGEENQPAETSLPEVPSVERQSQPISSSAVEGGSKMILEPPTLAGGLGDDAGAQPAADPMAKPAESSIPLLSHASGPAQMPSAQPLTTSFEENDGKTLTQLEDSVGNTPQATDVTQAQDAVTAAANASPDPYPKPIQALNAQHIDLNPEPVQADPAPAASDTAMPGMSFMSTNAPAAPQASDQTSPPPVPPPMVPDPTAQTAGEPAPQTEAEQKPAPDLAQVAL